MAVANRTAITRALDFSRFSSTFIRSFSTSSPSTSSSNPNASPASSKNKRRKKKNLFEVAQFLPNWGVGYHVAKAHWDEISYQITKINLYKVCFHLVSFIRCMLRFIGEQSPSIVCRNFEKNGIQFLPVVTISCMHSSKLNGLRVLKVLFRVKDQRDCLISVIVY